MLIPFINIDGRNIAKVEVEIPDQILNHFPIIYNDNGNVLDLPHIRPGVFTRVMGDAALRFNEPEDKLTIPEKKYKGIHVTPPIEDLLNKLGFHQRGGATFWHPVFGDDKVENWIRFDPDTDDISLLIPKTHILGSQIGSKRVKEHIRKALTEIF